MAGIIFNNILYCLDICETYVIIFDILLGNSFACTLLFFICSYVFRFCNWHRLVLTANLINITLIGLDYIFKFDVSNLSKILIYFTIDLIFIILILINKFKCKH